MSRPPKDVNYVRRMEKLAFSLLDTIYAEPRKTTCYYVSKLANRGGLRVFVWLVLRTLVKNGYISVIVDGNKKRLVLTQKGYKAINNGNKNATRGHIARSIWFAYRQKYQIVGRC